VHKNKIMAIVNIPTTENKWLIFFDDGFPSHYFDSALDQLTTFEDSYWTCEEYNTEAAYLARLLEFGITPDPDPSE